MYLRVKSLLWLIGLPWSCPAAFRASLLFAASLSTCLSILPMLLLSSLVLPPSAWNTLPPKLCNPIPVSFQSSCSFTFSERSSITTLLKCSSTLLSFGLCIFLPILLHSWDTLCLLFIPPPGGVDLVFYERRVLTVVFVLFTVLSSVVKLLSTCHIGIQEIHVEGRIFLLILLIIILHNEVFTWTVQLYFIVLWILSLGWSSKVLTFPSSLYSYLMFSLIVMVLFSQLNLIFFYKLFHSIR